MRLTGCLVPFLLSLYMCVAYRFVETVDVLDQSVRDRIVETLQREDAVFIAIFGSRATGTEDRASDLDILVSFSETKSLLDLVRIEREVSEATGLKVDLVTENALHPLIRDSVHQEMEVLVG